MTVCARCRRPLTREPVVVQGLGYGLDERAVAAVKQWKFNAGTRKGTPVDVMVEVAMEFKLR